MPPRRAELILGGNKMNRYQKKVNKLTKQRMFISPELNLRIKFRKIRKDMRKWYKDGFKEKDLKEINNLINWKIKFKEELRDGSEN